MKVKKYENILLLSEDKKFEVKNFQVQIEYLRKIYISAIEARAETYELCGEYENSIKDYEKLAECSKDIGIIFRSFYKISSVEEKRSRFKDRKSVV